MKDPGNPWVSCTGRLIDDGAVGGDALEDPLGGRVPYEGRGFSFQFATQASMSAASSSSSRSSGEALGAVAEVRRLVYALGDPVLDSLGLVGAVSDQASRFPSGQTAVNTTRLPGETPPEK